jgi:hypothetical protein
MGLLVSWKAGHVDPSTQQGPNEMAVLAGGPMDGREHPVQRDTDQLLVVMTDGQRHQYERSGMLEKLPNRRMAPVFQWRGRDGT